MTTLLAAAVLLTVTLQWLLTMARPVGYAQRDPCCEFLK